MRGLRVTKKDMTEYVNDLSKAWEYIKMGAIKQEKVTRVEVIDKNGRSYVNTNAKDVRLSYQDNGKTLKVFID